MEIFRLSLIILFLAFNGGFGLNHYNTAETVIVSSEELYSMDVDNIDHIIQEQKQRLENTFGPIPNSKPVISFTRSYQTSGTEDYLDSRFGGFEQRGTIYLLPYSLLKQAENLEKVLKHEYTHYFLRFKCPGLSAYLNEGLAVEFSGQQFSDCLPLSLDTLRRMDTHPRKYNAAKALYYKSAGDFIHKLLLAEPPFSLASALTNRGFHELDGLYEKNWKENTQQIRVWINPRLETRFVIQFKGKCALELSNQTGTHKREVERDIFVSFSTGRLIVDNETVDSALLRFADGFNLNQKNYRGNLQFLSVKDEVYVVNTLPVEHYLYSVVSSEMPKQKLEALKAQAVLSRTLAYYLLRNRHNGIYDINSLTSDQSYQGKDWETKVGNEAVQQTEGEVLTFHNEILYPYFSSTCGGHTAYTEEIWDEPAPYAQSRPCMLSNRYLCSNSPHFSVWNRELSFKDLDIIVGMNDSVLDIAETNSTGRVKSFIINGKPVLFDQFKSMAAKKKGWAFLKSPWLELIKNSTDQSYSISGKGLGHGVGLCQFGAAALADHYSYQKILHFYFTNFGMTNMLMQ